MSDSQTSQNNEEQQSSNKEVTEISNSNESPNAVNNKLEDPAKKELTKLSIRRQVWSYLEKNRLSSFPRPAYGKIPNFKGASDAAAKLKDLDEFKSAKSVEVNPDKPLEYSRMFVLENDKELFVPVPRLKQSLLKKLSKDEKHELKQIVSRWGLEHMGEAIDIDDNIHIDLFVLGSVAVSKSGYRIGKGRGYADLEYGILKDMKAINDDTVIVTTVHDCQVFDTLPEEIFKKYDVPVDYILTPTQIIKIEKKLPRPEGIFWDLLSNRRVNEMQILQKLKAKHEQEGKDTSLKENDTDVENIEQRPRTNRLRRFSRRRPRTRSRTSEEQENDDTRDSSKPDRFRRKSRYFRRSASAKKEKQASNGETTDNENVQKTRSPKKYFRRYPIDFSLVVSNIEKNVRVRDLKNALIENNIKPDSITWRGYRGFCYLHYVKPESKKKAKEAAAPAAEPYTVGNVVEVLQKMKINPESTCSLEVKVLEPITRIETTDVTAV